MSPAAQAARGPAANGSARLSAGGGAAANRIAAPCRDAEAAPSEPGSDGTDSLREAEPAAGFQGCGEKSPSCSFTTNRCVTVCYFVFASRTHDPDTRILHLLKWRGVPRRMERRQV
ncbi:unnamed protein product [Pleuronectes platessa]|uniref:Uncharacterized protein n=1 Tax=Pleuronectes platessa TaxID=8262 RepID=A0A9N7TRI3_PLEPL|nr:unnamed protein product [Pleuronectes platessa]